MRILEGIAIGVLVVVIGLAVLFARRAWLARAGGIITLNLRLSTMVSGRGWSPGFARFVGDELRWYRMFSFAVRPRRVLTRAGLAVESRRTPDSAERISLPADWVILRCTAHHAPVEIAMPRSTVTGFLSWLESAPPGSVTPRLATH